MRQDIVAESPGRSFAQIPTFREAHAHRNPGTQLRLLREAAPRFREWFQATGKPESVTTHDLVSVPYPTRFALFRAHASPAPFVTITNRLIVVRWREAGGRVRTLLFEPTDTELARHTPFFARLAARLPAFAERLTVKQHGTVAQHLATLGIRPEDVDYLTFDHLHTQDVRRLVGTQGPAADVPVDAGAEPGRPVRGLFPNATLLVQRAEWELVRELHPIQRDWYQPDTFRDLRAGSVSLVDGDVLLGPGVALLFTPGHTAGNHSLCLHTDTGIWVSSENAVAAECLTPEHSEIPGVRRSAAEMGHEVVLNGNTLETTAEQYNSCVKEKLVADKSRADERFVQFFPSSELTAHWMNPGTAPTFRHGKIEHGALRR